MKRSYMQLRLAEVLVELTEDDPIKAADQILRRLEKAGMLPPFSEERYYQTGMRNGYAWDLEDEKTNG